MTKQNIVPDDNAFAPASIPNLSFFIKFIISCFSESLTISKKRIPYLSGVFSSIQKEFAERSFSIDYCIFSLRSEKFVNSK